MVLTFADTQNMIAYLTKSDTSEGFNEIIDFLNASSIQYALTVNPNIYVSCIIQFWSSVSVKKVNDVWRLQALIDRKNVIITEATIREALRLDDDESIDCLPNEEIFTELSRMGLVRNVDSSTKFYIYPRLLQLMIRAQVVAAGVNVDDVPTADAEPSIPSPTPTTQPPPPSQELPSTSKVIPQELPSTKVEALEQDKVAQALEIIKLKQMVKKLERKNKLKVSGLRRFKKVGTAQRVESSADTVMDDQEDASKQGEIIANIDADEDVTLKDVAAVEKTDEIEENADVLSIHDDELEPFKLKKVVEVVTTANLMKEVVTAAAATITAATTPITAAIITAAPSAARRRKGVVIRDPEETATPSIIIHSKPKSKDKGKGIMVEEPKRLKKQAQIEQDEAYARDSSLEESKRHLWLSKSHKLETIRVMWSSRYNPYNHSDDLAGREKISIDKVHFGSDAEQVEELRKHLQIVPNNDDDVYTEATPLALKVPIVDYAIHTENNKPYFKIIRADGTHQLFLSFLSLLRNFDKEDLEPDVKAQVWKNQRGIYGLAKVKSWRLLESCGDHIITLTTTHMILLVERRYPLTRFTLDQMLNNVRLEVEEESEVSLELLRFVRK
nr:hypothetical protein [Tanacetum cinerariifolium]